jgi:hypothetical protein
MKDGYHWVDASPGGLLLVLPLLPLRLWEQENQRVLIE